MLKFCIKFLFVGMIGFYLFQLVQGERGLLDWYRERQEVEQIQKQISQIILENQELGEEVLKIKEDSSHQKKLVREILGHIEEKEYLVLFKN